MVCSVGVGTVADYYLSEQAEYYTGGKEPTGRWYAPGGFLELEDGEAVTVEAFRHLHDGSTPGGSALGKGASSPLSKRVGGYDLTFSAPKSVSVLWAVCDDKLRAGIEMAQEDATRAALDVLQRHAGFARRGKGGAILEPVMFAGATFQHGEARPTVRPDGTTVADPQLHTHAVIFNMAERADGTWGALDGRHFFKWKMAAGAIYRAELANRLQRELGLKLSIDDKGMFEVEGVPKTVREHFSSRRQDIEKGLSAHGLATKDAQKLTAAIAKTSRRTKNEVMEDAEERHQRWRREAEELGFGIEQAEAAAHQEATTEERRIFDDRLREIVLTLTEHEATFRLEDLYQAAAHEALKVGVDLQTMNEGVETLLARGQALEIGQDELGLPIYSTEEMITIENEVVRLAQAGAITRRHSLAKETVEQVLKDRHLTAEQRAGAEVVTTRADIVVLEGSAGAGKTHTLKSVADLYRDQGYRVIGTATAWRMALQLGQELNIRSQATDAWLAQVEAGKPFLDDKTALIVDEAGQLSSRQMLRLLEVANDAGAKVILTGDQRQLQAIGAGPGLRLVAEQTDVARIDAIVRQKDAWARQAVTDFSLGRAAEAFGALEGHGSIQWCADAGEAIVRAAQDWKAGKAITPDGTALVIAKTNAQVRALNSELRQHLWSAGQLIGPDQVVETVDGNGRTLDLAIAVEDQIQFRKRIPELGIINGTIGVVERISGHGADLRLGLEVDGRRVEVSSMEHGDTEARLPITHGYATTIYSSQGATVDRAYVVADHRLNRNEIYVAVSRAREAAQIYLDEAAVAKSYRANLSLSDLGRAQVARAELRSHLAASWSQAQLKTSTRDYSATKGMSQDRTRGANVEPRRSPSRARSLPKLELGH